MTMRLDFDHALYRLALGAGAVSQQGSALRDIDPEAQRVTLRDGRVFTYDFLIGADGINSMVAKTLFGRAFSLEVEIPRDKARHPEDVEALRTGRPERAFRLYCANVSGIITTIRQARFRHRFLYSGFIHRRMQTRFPRAVILHRGFLDILDGTRDYGALPGLLLRQVGASLKRRAGF
jgi:2-polyprenyl-6-methoxyphenol hydroxylase-like FAD-dependent oxidoreductase